MTFHLPPTQDRALTIEEKRQHVITYNSLKHGKKKYYLKQHGISATSFQRWRRAMADGSLERDIIPRKTGTMTTDDVQELAMMYQRTQELEEKLAQMEEKFDQARAHSRALEDVMSESQRLSAEASQRIIDQKDKQVEELKQAIDALGKAIAYMRTDGTS